jgi:hypothetical protein
MIDNDNHQTPIIKLEIIVVGLIILASVLEICIRSF